MRGLLLLAFVLTTSLLTTGCSLLGDCGRDRQHCVGDDCACGEACNGDEDCDGSDVCAFYDRAPNHGACVEVEYAERHELGSFAPDAGTNNANNTGPNNANNVGPNNANNTGTSNGGGNSCEFGTDCASGLCCGGNDACVVAAIACGESLSCADGSVSSNCFGACESDRHCASGWFCNESTLRCALGCSDNVDCSGDETCQPDGRCVPSPSTFCSHPDDCDRAEVCALPLDEQELSCIASDGTGSPGDPCFDDIGCENRLCIGGECAALCENSIDCEPDGGSCMPAEVDRDGAVVVVDVCTAATCSDDDSFTSFSDNHSMADAAGLPPDEELTLSELKVCPGAPDWYFRPEPAGTLIAGAVAVTDGDGTIDDVSIQVFDEEGSVLATGVRSGPGLQFDFVAPTTSAYYYEVRTEAGVVYDFFLAR